ncbi:MAG: SRPBCC family protein [Chloroflexi bacterium]|nr:SRPBCC family protein [Chloroflexota bacterium]
MSQIIETVDVDVPVRVAYDQWTQFEEFPRFMEAIEKVEQLDDTTLRWTAKIAGVTKSWTATITEQSPDQRIAWTATEGAENAGVVTFHRLDDRKTRVTLQLDVEPEGVVESAGDALGFVQRQTKGDLKRFKEFVEGRGVATGAWRGEVKQDDVTG